MLPNSFLLEWTCFRKRLSMVWSKQDVIIEPAHDKTYNKILASSEDSDQPAYPCSLIRVFSDLMCLLQPPKRGKQKSLAYWWMYRLILFFAGRTSLSLGITYKMASAPSENSDQPRHPPSLIRVLAVRMKKALVLCYPLSAQQWLIRLGGWPGSFESSLGTHAIL